MPPKPNTIKADADLQLVIGVIHQLLPDGKSNGKLKIDFAGLAVYLGSGKPDSARMRWNRFIQRVDWETGKMIDAAATTSGAGDGGDCGGPSASKEDKDNKKDGLKRQLDDNDADLGGHSEEEVTQLAVQTPRKKRKIGETES